MKFNPEQLEKYSRQMILSGFGGLVQEKLYKSNVLVVGAGGLGSSTLLYLASSGIGNIGIADFDEVELSNLHRQVIHSEEDIGKSKVESAKEKILKRNSDLNVKTFKEKVEESNIAEITEKYEVIVDALDNFNDKFLLNDYCTQNNKKLIHAGATGYIGQVLSIDSNKTANLKHLFPEGIDVSNQSCKEVGILPTCVGLISLIQANEVIKICGEVGEPLYNRMIVFDSLKSTFKEVSLKGLVL